MKDSIKKLLKIIALVLLFLVFSFSVGRFIYLAITAESFGNEKTLLLFKQFVICLICLFVIVSFFIIFFKHQNSVNFAVLVFPCACLYMLVLTPLSTSDSVYHFSMAEKTANLLSFHFNMLNTGDATYTYIFDKAKSGVFVGHYNCKSGYVELVNALFQEKSMYEGTLPLIASHLIYPIPYIPHALGLVLGRVFQIHYIFQYYLGVLFSVAFYAVMLGFAFKLTPTQYKTQFTLMVLLPMALHQSAAYTYDVFVNALSLTLISLVLNIANSEDSLSKKKYLVLLLTTVLLAPVKYVYIFLIFLIFIVPRNTFKDRKDFLLKLGILISVAFVSAALFFMLSRLFSPTSGSDVPYYTIDFVLRHPVETILIFARTILDDWNWWIFSFIGGDLGGLTLPIPHILIYGYALLLAITLFNKQDEVSSLSKKNRLLLVLISFIIVLAIMGGMFTGWTPNTSDVIEGVQGRYFIPIGLLLLIAFRNNILVYTRNLDKYIVFTAVLINAAVIFEIVDWTLKNS